MTYATGRLYHDADSHIMEPHDWLQTHAEDGWSDRMPLLGTSAIGSPEGAPPIDWPSQMCPLHLDPDYRSDESQLMLRKNYEAVGSFERDHRSQALDQLGFASQFVYNTWTSSVLQAAEHGPDLDLAYAMADAHNNGMAHFCSVDERLLPVLYVALADPVRAADQASRAVAAGASALMIASACPRTHSPSHIDLEPMWAVAAEAGVPIVMHVGGAGQLLDPQFFANGRPKVADFHGGAENFRSIDYMAIPVNPMQTTATLIIDGVLDRHPNLRIGIIEQGGSWLPGWMRYLDSAYAAFRKNEERLQELSAPPSEIVRRQVRVTPYPHEDTGWIIRNSGPEICMFSSDYPHTEGGRNPLKRFNESLEGCSEEEVDRFYSHNMIDLMGTSMPSSLPV